MLCAGYRLVVWVIVLFQVFTAAWGQQIILPGPWYDRDKLNVDGDHYTLNSYDDVNGNGKYDPGEPYDGRANYVDPTWVNPQIMVSDNSCWAAAASNVLRYMGGPDRYMAWVYEGQAYDAHTWEIGGWPYRAFEGDGYVGEHLTTGEGVDVPSVLMSVLETGRPANISFFWDGGGHSITCYGYDAETRTMWLADSDADRNERNFNTSTLQFNGERWYVERSGADTWIDSIDTIGAMQWQGAGTGGDTSLSGPTTLWSRADNWSPAQLPGQMSPVWIDMPGVGQVVVDGSARGMQLVMRQGRLLVSRDGQLQTGRVWGMDGQLSVGFQGAVTVDQSLVWDGQVSLDHATVTVGTVMHVGYERNGAGMLLDHGSQLETGDLIVGREGQYHRHDDEGRTGELEVRGGSSVRVTGDMDVEGTVQIIGSTLQCDGRGRLANALDSRFVMRDGSTVQFGTLELRGSTLGNDADFLMWDGLLVTGGTTVGRGGHASFSQYGGEHRIDGNLVIDRLGGYHSQYMMQGGLLHADNVVVGRYGQECHFYHWGGRVEVTGQLTVAGESESDGSIPEAYFDMRDGATLSMGQMVIGEDGEGVFTQSGGTVTVNGDVRMGNGAYANALYTMTGGALHIDGGLMLGQSRISEAVFDQQGGQVEVGGSLTLGNQASIRAEVRLGGMERTGISQHIGGDLVIGNDASALNCRYVITGSGIYRPVLEVAGDIHVGAQCDGAMEMSGGQVTGGGEMVVHAGTGTLSGYGQIDLPVTNHGTVTTAHNLPLVFNDRLTSDGQFTVASDGLNSGRVELAGGGQFDSIVTNQGTIHVAGTTAVWFNGGMNGGGQLSSLGPVYLNSPAVLGQVHLSGPDADLHLASDLDADELVAEFGASVSHVAGMVSLETVDLVGDGFSGLVPQYHISGGGVLQTQQTVVGGLFVQGVSEHLTDRLAVGREDLLGGYGAVDGHYRVDAGRLTVGQLVLGTPDRVEPWDPLLVIAGAAGTLEITDPTASLTVTDRVVIHEHGRLMAEPGTILEMTGTHWLNHGLDAAGLAGLANLTLHYTDTGGQWDLFEVASGLEWGLTDNFLLGRLWLGDQARLRLVDEFDNGRRGPAGNESLLVGQLTFEGDSVIDLAGLVLVCPGNLVELLEGYVNDGHLVDSVLAGYPVEVAYEGLMDLTTVRCVPEPGMAGLLVLGLASLAGRRGKRAEGGGVRR